MLSLHDLQQQFAETLLGVEPTAFSTHIRTNGIPASARLRIYRNNVFESLTGALAACYPVVRRLVGDGFFNQQAQQYIRSHPLYSGNLHQYGSAFPEFLNVSLEGLQLPYLPDVARLEWACQEAYHAPEADGLDLDALAAVSPDHYDVLRFKLNPASQLVASVYPVFQIWRVNQPDWRGDETVSLDSGGDRLLVMRQRHGIEIERLSEGDYVLLRHLSAGETLFRASEQAMASDPKFDLTASLRRHVVGQTVVAFDTGSRTCCGCTCQTVVAFDTTARNKQHL